MDDVTRKRIDAFDRCEQWFAYNAAGVNTIGKLKNLALEFKTKLTTFHDTAGALVLSLTDNLMQGKRTARLHHRKRLRRRRSGFSFMEIGITRRSPTQEKGTNANTVNICPAWVFYYGLRAT